MNGPAFLIAGLGNPGEKYRDTRHNLGFWVVDELAKRWRVGGYSNKFKAEYAPVPPASTGAAGAFLLKPQTFMNLSGESVAAAANFYKIPIETHLIVVSDDLDLPVGALRLRLTGGSGGHNGLKSLFECLGTQAFPRLRIGVGRSANLPSDVYLLSKIASADREAYEIAAKAAADGIELCVKEGVAVAMNKVNLRSEAK